MPFKLGSLISKQFELALQEEEEDFDGIEGSEKETNAEVLVEKTGPYVTSQQKNDSTSNESILEEQLDKANERIFTLLAEIEELTQHRREKRKIAKKLSSLQEDYDELEQTNASLTEENSLLQSSMNSKAKEIESLRKDNEELAQEKEEVPSTPEFEYVPNDNRALLAKIKDLEAAESAICLEMNTMNAAKVKAELDFVNKIEILEQQFSISSKRAEELESALQVVKREHESSKIACEDWKHRFLNLEEELRMLAEAHNNEISELKKAQQTATSSKNALLSDVASERCAKQAAEQRNKELLNEIAMKESEAEAMRLLLEEKSKQPNSEPTSPRVIPSTYVRDFSDVLNESWAAQVRQLEQELEREHDRNAFLLQEVENTKDFYKQQLRDMAGM
ncbi:hypothetical protein PCE1_001720 [Barthelona sp. PCE]